MERARHDWQLTAFRLGAFACLVWAVITFTQFDFVASSVALYDHHPTAQEAADANLAASRKKAACLALNRAGGGTEYPSNCLYDIVTIHGLPRDEATVNLDRFVAALAILAAGLVLVAALGIRMARASITPH